MVVEFYKIDAYECAEGYDYPDPVEATIFGDMIRFSGIKDGCVEFRIEDLVKLAEKIKSKGAD